MKIKKINFRPRFNSKDIDVLLESKLVGTLIHNNILETYTFYATDDLFEYFSEENHFKSPQEFEQNFENNFPIFIERLQNKVNEVYGEEIVHFDKLKPIEGFISEYKIFSRSVCKLDSHFENCIVTYKFSPTNFVEVFAQNYVSFDFSKFGCTTNEEYVDKLVYKKYFEIRWLNKISNGIVPIFYFIYGDDFVKNVTEVNYRMIFNTENFLIL